MKTAEVISMNMLEKVSGGEAGLIKVLFFAWKY